MSLYFEEYIRVYMCGGSTQIFPSFFFVRVQRSRERYILANTYRVIDSNFFPIKLYFIYAPDNNNGLCVVRSLTFKLQLLYINSDYSQVLVG